MTTENWRIFTPPCLLTEGIFGQIVLGVFEVLPKLYQNKIYPDWKITSLVYGLQPDFKVIPGIFDLNYEIINTQKKKNIDLRDLRYHFVSVLGNQWADLNKIWTAYFCIPTRILKRAESFGDMNHALGLHYRGTDKNKDCKQTNPVSNEDFLSLIHDFINNKRDIDTIFIASDEFAIKQAIKEKYKDKRVIDTGEVSSWRSLEKTGSFAKGDHAVLDCLLLSRCKYLIKNQSALSGFAKVLNPELESYRIAASKLFVDIPYFPDAYIPPLTSDDPKCNAILTELLKDDWTQNQRAYKKFSPPFLTMERSSLKWKIEQTYKYSRRKLHLEK
jgi:hypothetical protein